MRVRVLSVLLLTVVLVAALSGPAWAGITPGTSEYTSADQCYTCHQGTGAALSKVDFSAAGAVNYSKCAKCHSSLPRVGHYHFGFTLPVCSNCHGYTVFPLNLPEDAFVVSTPPVVTAYGSFTNSDSLSTTPAELHRIHESADWVEDTYAYSYFGSTKPRCSTCHAITACSACHDETGISHSTHAVSQYPAVTFRATAATFTYWSNIIGTVTSTCVNPACHDLANAGTTAFTPTCGSCHPAQTSSHGYADVDHIAADGVSDGYTCTTCHSLDLSTAHGDSVAIGTSCATCHPTPRDSLVTWDQSCSTAGCHTAASTAPMHADKSAAHAVSSANLLCLDCHAGTELESIHVSAVSKTDSTRTSCLVCHSAAAAPATSDCTACHFTFEAHYDGTKHAAVSVSCSGAGCHDTSTGLMGLHQQRNADFNCWGCHNSVRSDVQYAIDNNLTGCGDCHSDIYSTTGHRDVHWPVPVLQDSSGPHYSYYTGSTGSAPTNDCAGCHTSNLMDEHVGLYLGGVVFMPRKDSAGNDLTCDTCHASTVPKVIAAISSGGKTCESCHDVHGPMADVHSSTFVDSPQIPCADCHSANIAEEHNGGYTSSAGLTGCDVCHALYSGASGPIDAATVQGAISVSNSTKCSACHSTYHSGMAPHIATTAPSIACAECHGTVVEASLDVNTVHPKCTTCHGAAEGRIDWATATFECSSCHLAQGTDFHQGMTAHVTPTTGCSVSGCHHSSTDVSVFHPSCSTCHVGTTDLGKTTACENCHGTVQGTDYHVAFDSAHAPADAASLDCAGCHDTTNVTQLHVTDGCNTCHFQTGCGDCHQMHMGGTGLTKTTACANCHATEGTDYHSNMTVNHTFSTMPTSCTTGTRCHVANTLPEEHARFIAEYGYTSTCDLCHKNTDPTRIDWSTATADCSTCHDVHGDIATIHTATSSQACVDCHESGDVMTIHGTTPDASCDVCHNAAPGRIDWQTVTIECASCHGALSPTDPNHYVTLSHDASAETACNQCHYKDMKAEHFKPTVAVSCVTCHEVKVDAFTAPWDKTCAACHPTKHGERAVKHRSTNSSCAGTNCHDITDVSAIHGEPDGPGCGACHINAATPATTTDCAVCHPGVGTNHHSAHDASLVDPAGCQGCHFMFLDDEHLALGYTCDTCHKSTATLVVNAIATKDLRCKSCHPNMHTAQDFEFNPGRASVHRVSSTLPGMRSGFAISGTTYSWSLPSASSFLKTGWTTDSMMSCSDCHSYSGATGPHGATMKVNIDPAYPNPYKVTTGSSSSTAQLSKNSPTGMSMTKDGSTAAGIICEKCHDLNGTGSGFSNIVHNEHDDRGSEGGYCNYCHTALPHGWSRPRLIGYTTDSAPYNTYAGGVQRISLKSYTPSSWQKSDCGAACSSDRHPLTGTSWPSSGSVTPAPTTGSVMGSVKNSTGGAISGATVTVAGKTATTNTSGAYSIADVAAGSQTLTVSASGYQTWSGSVTVTAGGSVTQNVTLAAVPVTQYGNVAGTVKDSSGSAISGATVSVGGKTATTSSTGTYSITGVVTGTYTMTVSASGYNNWSGSVTISANTTFTQNVTLTGLSTNLARAGAASASSVATYYYAASKAIDGSTSSYWRSNGHDSEWLRVDLGSSKTINKVVVNWYGSYYARTYRVETSSDGSNWTQRYSNTSGNGGVDEIAISGVTARYVRVYCTYANYSDYRISEFEVWGY